MDKTNINFWAVMLLVLLLGLAELVRADNTWPQGDTLCLAANIYHEARGESTVGKLLVAQITLNRVASDKYPNSICKVVKQKHQFSWYWDKKSDYPKDTKAWDDALSIAMFYTVYNRILPIDISDGATHYYAFNKIRPPAWVSSLTEVTTVGSHKFYKF